MDAFFASVEQLDYPYLRGKPIAVGGGGRRGVVGAASYEARQYGVKSAMPGFIAKQKCPHLIFVSGRYDRYKEISNQVREIFYRYTDMVEPLSIDEAYLDVTENKKCYQSAIKVAYEIRKAIYEEIGLTASAGISVNKFIAKVASDMNKPNGMTTVLPQDVDFFLENLPIEKFYGIGEKTAGKLREKGIYNGLDLKSKDIYYLKDNFGKMGIYFYNIVRGIDKRSVEAKRNRKSIGVERTFSSNEDNYKFLSNYLLELVDLLFERMLKVNAHVKTVVLKIKYDDFEIVTRSDSFKDYIFSKELIYKKTLILLEQNYDSSRKIRLLGVSVTNLSLHPSQLKLPL